MSGGMMFDGMTGLDDTQTAALSILREFTEWPTDDGKDAALIRRLTATYPTLDLVEQAGLWLEWMNSYRERHPRKQIAPRHRFANWCKQARAYAGRSVTEHRAPAGQDQHGGTRTVEW